MSIFELMPRAVTRRSQLGGKEDAKKGVGITLSRSRCSTAWRTPPLSRSAIALRPRIGHGCHIQLSCTGRREPEWAGCQATLLTKCIGRSTINLLETRIETCRGANQADLAGVGFGAVLDKRAKVVVYLDDVEIAICALALLAAHHSGNLWTRGHGDSVRNPPVLA